jgi:hypothetical protein
MSSLVLFKVIACLLVDHHGCLAKCSRSSFALVISYMQVKSCFLFSVMPMRAVSEKSKPMRVELRTGIIRLGVPMDGILF